MLPSGAWRRPRARRDSERPRQPYPRPRLDVPLHILISGRTGSAAEAAAYTLQAAKRAVIVGEASAGAANPGEEFPAGEGFRVFVSTGTPINPVTGGNWEGTGVEPDIAVPAARALHHAQTLALATVLARHPDPPASRAARWALEALHAEDAPPCGPALAALELAYSSGHAARYAK